MHGGYLSQVSGNTLSQEFVTTCASSKAVSKNWNFFKQEVVNRGLNGHVTQQQVWADLFCKLVSHEWNSYTQLWAVKCIKVHLLGWPQPIVSGNVIFLATAYLL